MPVDVRPQRAFGIVGMNHAHVVEPQESIRFRYHFLQPFGARHIETRCQ